MSPAEKAFKGHLQVTLNQKPSIITAFDAGTDQNDRTAGGAPSMLEGAGGRKSSHRFSPMNETMAFSMSFAYSWPSGAPAAVQTSTSFLALNANMELAPGI